MILLTIVDVKNNCIVGLDIYTVTIMCKQISDLCGARRYCYCRMSHWNEGHRAAPKLGIRAGTLRGDTKPADEMH